MPLNNLHIIQTILSTKVLTEDHFFFVQCIRRRKDTGNEDMTVNNIVVDNILVHDGVDLERRMGRIIKVCDTQNARAYIRLNKRSYRTVALQTLSLMAKHISDNHYRVKDTYFSCCGSYSAERSFLVDVDHDDITFDVEDMTQYIRELLTEAGKETIIHTVPTKNGFHYITSGFNTQKFNARYPSVSIHKDNPSVLYCP
jgi:hypothetical protein